MEAQKSDLQWLMNKSDNCSTRYMEDEQMLLNIIGMNFFKRLFIRRKILSFLKSRSKYNF
jgi:hypothetical protein